MIPDDSCLTPEPLAKSLSAKRSPEVTNHPRGETMHLQVTFKFPDPLKHLHQDTELAVECTSPTISTGVTNGSNEEVNRTEETLLEDKAPTTPTETSIPGLTLPISIRTRHKERRRANFEIAGGPEPEPERDTWALKPLGDRCIK